MTKLLSIREAAEMKNLSVTTVWRWIVYGFQGKKLYAKRYGKQYRINENTFEAFFQ